MEQIITIVKGGISFVMFEIMVGEVYINTFLGNWFEKSFMFMGLEMSSAEQAFQYAKYLVDEDKDALDAIMACKTPKEVKDFADGRGVKDGARWRKVSLQTMKDVIMAKFADEQMRNLLLATGDSVIVEISETDNFYGCTVDENGVIAGHNKLGWALMEVRDYYRQLQRVVV